MIQYKGFNLMAIQKAFILIFIFFNGVADNGCNFSQNVFGFLSGDELLRMTITLSQ